VHDRKGKQTKGAIEKTVNGDAAEPLGQSRRSRDIDEQHETVLFKRRMIAPGDKVQECARPDDIGDHEYQVHQNREHGGSDKGGPETLIGGTVGYSGDDLTQM